MPLSRALGRTSTRTTTTLTSARQDVGSCAGGHVGGENVVGVSVEVLAGAVVAHGGPWVGVPGRDLDVAEVDAGVAHGGDEDVPQHVRVHPGQRDAGLLGEPPQPGGGAVRSIRVLRDVNKIGPVVRSSIDRSRARLTAGGSGTRTTLSPFPRTR